MTLGLALGESSRAGIRNSLRSIAGLDELGRRRLARTQGPGSEPGEALAAAGRVHSVQSVDHFRTPEPVGRLLAGAQMPA